jgi:hypothetical protein
MVIYGILHLTKGRLFKRQLKKSKAKIFDKSVVLRFIKTQLHSHENTTDWRNWLSRF